ncbi:MAG: hypothetical protein E2P02_18635 [Acidobacteria bacterium]|nr:MAG: hypothetical protein E2P02_18635 [Acidobacteriota bacterium]
MLALLAATVMLLSIDGLKPDYELEADAHGLRIPHLRSVGADVRFNIVQYWRAATPRRPKTDTCALDAWASCRSGGGRRALSLL